MKKELPDKNLVDLVRDAKDNEALLELIERHSGIYIDE